jgi:hypothetical protein
LPGGQEHVTVVDGPVAFQDPDAAQSAFAAQTVVHDLDTRLLQRVQHAGADRDLDRHAVARHGDLVRTGGVVAAGSERLETEVRRRASLLLPGLANVPEQSHRPADVEHTPVGDAGDHLNGAHASSLSGFSQGHQAGVG